MSRATDIGGGARRCVSTCDRAHTDAVIRRTLRGSGARASDQLRFRGRELDFELRGLAFSCSPIKTELTLPANRRDGLQTEDGPGVPYVMKRLQVLATQVSFSRRHEACTSTYDKRTAADELGIGLWRIER